MPKMVVTHAVVEIERWLQGKAERAAVIGKYATNVTDHVAADGSSNVAITADIHDMEGLQALMASPSPEDAAAEERHGVIQPITVYIEKKSVQTGLRDTTIQATCAWPQLPQPLERPRVMRRCRV